jgi:hypothetical protein
MKHVNNAVRNKTAVSKEKQGFMSNKNTEVIDVFTLTREKPAGRSKQCSSNKFFSRQY